MTSCSIHEDHLEQDHGVCYSCRLESYHIMKAGIMHGLLPQWIARLPCWIDLKPKQ